MKSLILTLILFLAFGLKAWPAEASTSLGDEPRARAYDHPGHVSIGVPGAADEVSRIIEVNIKETESGYMLFDPDAIQIEKSTVVRFVINNSGALDHEFFLGSFDEIGKHQQWMRQHPDMAHDDPNSVAIQSGETAMLDWKFSEMTNLEFVCLVPGHREAGMWGVIIVHDHLAPKSKG
jgi:uncharacterized cupredoxin-like copper-binding protein